MKKNYELEFLRVCDYILLHLDRELSLEELSQLSEISKYHFHRLFAAHLGLNLYRYIQLQRFKRASYQLAFSLEMKIIDIALDAKFESPEAFSRSFKKVFEVTPRDFRKCPNWEAWHEKYRFNKIEEKQKMDVKVIKLNEIKIAVLEHHGSPESLNHSIPKFIEWRKQTGLSPVEQFRTFGVVFNDPNNTPPEEFRFDICGEVQTEIPKNEFGVIQKLIPEGRYAVVRHIGPHDKMDEKIYRLYRQWLPQSGEELRDYPLFFQYHNFFPEVAENELITDIHLPIK